MYRDRYGNPLPPRFDRLVMFDVRGDPDHRYQRLLEATLRKLERTYPWGPQGLLFLTAWGHGYFTNTLATESPFPQARAYSDFESPRIDDYDLCLHLACNDERRLTRVTRQLIGELSPILTWRETRTGFNGAGLPYTHQHVQGIPSAGVVARTAPMYMGFKTILKKNQASEDAVTIADGPFAEGTTMTVSYMTLTLDDWYQTLDQAQRVALMYSPQTTIRAAERFTTDAESNPDKLSQAITKYSMIGHAQASARARRDNKPIILRRDFNTSDGGQAGLHFVSLQRSIEDFVKTRQAMNQTGVQLKNPAIGDTQNNGINAFIFVTRRENFIVPSRAHRSFPLLSE